MSSLKKRKKKSLISQIFHTPFVLKSIAIIARTIVSVLLKTLRVTFEGQEYLSTPSKRNTPIIICIWHNSLLLGPLIRRVSIKRKYFAVVSKSKDGDLLSSFIQTYPEAEVIRVAHNSRHQAAIEIVEQLKNGATILITPDGPRGPRHVVKDGALWCAQKTHADVICLSWRASKCIEVPTWDRFRIPLPFSKVHITISQPLQIEKGKDISSYKDIITQNLLSSIK